MEYIKINDSKKINENTSENTFERTFITFIIPSIGRDTLLYTIESLYNLQISDWRAIVVFDGIKNDNLNEKINNIDTLKKIIIINSDIKYGNISVRNSAGLVRNIGIESINFPTEWVGFVDDDDTISPYYINNLKSELLLNHNIDVCIFRMMYENGYVLPTKYDRNIMKNRVGISFALKKDIIDKNLFINNPFEDYIFLKELQNKGFKILISSYISYYVRLIYDLNNSIINNSNDIVYPKIYLN